MSFVSRLLRSACVLLTVAVWTVTIATDPMPSSITAAAVLTGIVAFMVILTLSD